MPELKIRLPDDLDKRFRKTAMKVHGYGRGSISKAAIEAISKWCTEYEASASTPEETSSKEERTSVQLPRDEKNPESQKTDKDETPPQVEQASSTSGASLPTA